MTESLGVCRLARPRVPMAAFSLDRAAPLVPQDASIGSVAQSAFENAGARVASSTSIAVPVLLAPKEIVGERVSHKTADTWLRNWRALHGNGGEAPIIGWEEDWTLSSCCREYISHRIDADVIIGVGIVKFCINFISHYDKHMNQNRCDFIAWRADGSTCRIHPSASGPGNIVIGMPCDWIDKSASHASAPLV